MTGLNLNVKIVDGLLVGSEYETNVWIDGDSLNELKDFAQRTNEGKQFFKKLKYYATAGFREFEGKTQRPIKHEGDGVYRIGKGLFRLVGFYESDNRARFIILDAFRKRKQKLSDSERGRIKVVKRRMAEGLWRRKT